MRRRVLLAGLALSLACGARTGLVLPGGAAGTGSGGSSGGGATPLAVKCTAALLDGAPTPMPGYCPTQANQASANGPRAPTVVWSVAPFPIETPENFLPAEIVVDPSGRAYVAIDASPLNPDASGTLFAVDPDGNVAWSLQANASSLALGSDGNLWMMGAPQGAPPPTNAVCETDAGFDEPTCVAGPTALSFAGAVVENLVLVVPPMPPNDGVDYYDSMALASDGSFFLEASSPIAQQGGIAHASRDGAILWQWPSPNLDEYLQVVPPLVVGSGDDVVVAGSGELLQFDADGNQIWEEGSGIQTEAVDARGNVVALTTSGGPTGDALALLTIDPAGDIAQTTVPFGATTANVFQLALAGDGTTVILLANEATAPGLTKSHVEITAVDVSGATRWTTPLDVTLPYDPATLTTHYGVFVDGSGTVVVTAGAVTGIDLATGAILWTLQPPNPHACLRPAVLGASGAILASQCDGTVFLARDP